jgi:3-isopropylmalate dehydratase
LEENVKEFGLTYFGMKDRRQGVLPSPLSFDSFVEIWLQGIVHVIGPEQGFTVGEIAQ